MKAQTRIVASMFAAMPLVILTLSVFCTWALAHGAAASWRAPFLLLCHGIPRRCLTLWNTRMPICARCVAIYGGMLIGLLTFSLLPKLRERTMRIVLGFAIAPLAIDGITQALRLRESTNDLRVATGLAAGLACAAWLLAAMERPESPAFTNS